MQDPRDSQVLNRTLGIQLQAYFHLFLGCETEFGDKEIQFGSANLRSLIRMLFLPGTQTSELQMDD